MSLAVIPARGGSKRIPRKNIKPFHGKPMILWSIEAARASGCFERIVVSTDDAEIAELARGAGAEVPFMRPADLADDLTPTVPVIAHAIAAVGHGDEPVCCIYATAPFVTADDIRRGRDVLAETGADYAMSATSFAFPVQRGVIKRAGGLIEMLHPEHNETRSQDLSEVYHDAGQFYWGRAEAWTAGRPIMSGRTAMVELPRHRVQDIDTPEDWARAEAMFAVQNRAYSVSG